MSAAFGWAPPLKQFIMLYTGWDELDFRFSLIFAFVILVLCLAAAVIDPIMWLVIGGAVVCIVLQLSAFRLQIWGEMGRLAEIRERHDYSHVSTEIRERDRKGISYRLGVLYAYCALMIIASLGFIASAIEGA